MKCKRNKWDCEEGGGGGHFQRRKVQVACLDRDKIEKEWRCMMMWSKWHYCQCSSLDTERTDEGHAKRGRIEPEGGVVLRDGRKESKDLFSRFSVDFL